MALVQCPVAVEGVLEYILHFDKCVKSFHTHQTKKQSKQWFKKGKLGQIKVEVQASNSKLLTFFELKGLIHTNSIPREQTVNATYIRKALGRFMMIFGQKRFIMASEDWFLR